MAESSRTGTPSGRAVTTKAHTDVKDPAYGARYKTIAEVLGETLAEAVSDSAATEALTLSEGSNDSEFRQFGIENHKGAPAVSTSFVDTETGDDLDVYFDVDGQKLRVYSDDSEVTGKEADEAPATLPTPYEDLFADVGTLPGCQRGS